MFTVFEQTIGVDPSITEATFGRVPASKKKGFEWVFLVYGEKYLRVPLKLYKAISSLR